MGLSLGYPCASCEEIKFNVGIFSWFPWVVTNKLIVGRYGAVDVTDLFPLGKEKFPVRPVINNIYNELTIHSHFNIRFNGYIRFIYLHKTNHYVNRFNRAGGYQISTGIEIALSKGFKPIL